MSSKGSPANSSIDAFNSSKEFSVKLSSTKNESVEISAFETSCDISCSFAAVSIIFSSTESSGTTAFSLANNKVELPAWAEFVLFVSTSKSVSSSNKLSEESKVSSCIFLSAIVVP